MMALWDTIPAPFIPQGISWRDKHEGLNPLRAEVPINGNRGQQPWLRNRFVTLFANFSPDGQYLAYTSDSSGQFELYVQPYPATGEIWQISTAGAFDPRWSPKGDEYFYRDISMTKMMVVPIESEPEFKAGKPRVLFEGEYLDIAGPSFDVSADGRFLMLKGTEKGTKRMHLNVVVNWFEELQRLVPGGK